MKTDQTRVAWRLNLRGWLSNLLLSQPRLRAGTGSAAVSARYLWQSGANRALAARRRYGVGGGLKSWDRCAGFEGRAPHPERMEIAQPRVARNELPWGRPAQRHRATLKELHRSGVCLTSGRATALGTQGNRSGSTLSGLAVFLGPATQGRPAAPFSPRPSNPELRDRIPAGLADAQERYPTGSETAPLSLSRQSLNELGSRFRNFREAGEPGRAMSTPPSGCALAGRKRVVTSAPRALPWANLLHAFGVAPRADRAPRWTKLPWAGLRHAGGVPKARPEPLP
jgi:hypothetical protein